MGDLALTHSFEFMPTDMLEEILACMEDSDRYIVESNKNRIIEFMKQELVSRGHKQYKTSPTSGDSG